MRFRSFDPAAWRARLEDAITSRASVTASRTVTAWRALDGAGDDVPGLSLDVYATAAVLNVDDDGRYAHDEVSAIADAALAALHGHGVEAVYVKAFARDRSRLGGALGDESRSAVPRAGRPQPATLVVEEHGTRFEVRPYDGLSTGLFLDHREHRRALGELRPARVLNLFAYTCAFAMPLARAGAAVTNVDVSGRYLEWGRRNLVLNDLDAASMRFLRRDAREFLRQAARKADERFDLVILDPPTFAAANRQRGVAVWRAVDDYPALVADAVRVVAPGGLVFAASNTRELAAEAVLESIVETALPRRPRWRPLPPWPPDVTAPGRVAAVLFAP